MLTDGGDDWSYNYTMVIPCLNAEKNWKNENPSKKWTPTVGQVVKEYIEKVV